MYGRAYGRAIFSQPKFLGCLGNQILLPMVKSNPVNTDTEGAIDSFLMNGVFVLSGMLLKSKIHLLLRSKYYKNKNEH